MKLGVFSTLFLVLLVLKLCELVAISWWWVLAPLLVVVVWWVVVIPLTFLAVLSYAFFKEYKRNGSV